MLERADHVAGFDVFELVGPEDADLTDEVGAAERLVRAVHDGGTGVLILPVGKASPDAGAAFHDDLMAALQESARGLRRQAHAVLVPLGFAGDSDDHASSTVLPTRACAASMRTA